MKVDLRRSPPVSHDVGWTQRGRSLGFVAKPRDVRLFDGQIGVQDFQRDVPPQRALFGEINLGHGAAASRRN